MNPAIRFILALLMMFYIILAVPALALAGMLLMHAETSPGRLFAGGVLTGVPIPVMLWFASYLRRRRGVLRVAAWLGFVALLLLGADYTLTPNGRPMPGSPARSIFTGTASYHRASIANLVPEFDQLVLGARLVPALDRLMDPANATELQTQVRKVYGEMLRSPEFECLGSAMNLTYRDLLLGDRPTGHLYEYIPKSDSSAPLPVILFLHGSLGNFRGYLWVWKRIADEHGFAIVAPTFGTGNWDAPGGDVAIERARLYCSAHPKLDPSRIYLAGLSNGGRGVCLGAGQTPDAWRGLVLISPVVDTRLLLTDAFKRRWAGKPILVLHGTADNRIPVGYIDRAVETIKGLSPRIEYERFDRQTHFLFFTIRRQVQDRIGIWLSTSAS